MYEVILALLMTIAIEEGVPPLFVKAIALTENTTLNPNAISPVNRDGTRDHGVMQLNDAYFGHLDVYDPEANIRAGVKHIKFILSLDTVDTYWVAALVYNAGTRWLLQGAPPPYTSLDYADEVMRKFTEFHGDLWYVCPVIRWDSRRQRFMGRY